MASNTKSFNPNKHLKEQFVSNLNGSSKLELFLVMVILIGSVLIRRAIGSRNIFGFSASEGFSKKNDGEIVRNKSLWAYISTMTVDYLFILVPFVSFLTVLSGWIYLNATLVIFFLLVLFSVRRIGSLFLQEDGVISFRRHVTSYRVLMMLATCVCILAVDFKIFPRRYAKTETYGFSLMDLGVGSFVLANSLVSRQARDNSITTLRNVAYSCSPLILLGFARLIFTSGVDYQVHVGEYGVHWNFFFTLAGVAILTSIINVPSRYCGLLGFSVLAGYQFCLSRGLNKFLLSDERGTDVITQNKEGIFSMFGYWGLYLIGVQLGNYFLFGKHSTVASRSSNWARIRVWILCLLFWSLTLFLDQYVERVSRRMCNLAYVALVLAINLQVLAMLTLSDLIPGSRISLLEEAFNQNLLASFLLANVLTGLVNLSVNTLFVSSTTALAILLAYAFILCASVGCAYFYGLKLKFW
ncbi:OLC1v1032588C1 [Oldenlandia corymbosa var. corymbosa]|uniref:OLC1v1032588C1 n=1 Tax=Oldenlandia corymbosa var. corymbosa TaxID=529605 RepID=A0AAV1CPC3_OLDCO|nr:OLC1v1032588C1 [Oldenlandia corymbosa var. corymbosa]